MNSGGNNKKSGVSSSTSRKSGETSGAAGYNNDCQSDDSILEDRADASVTKVQSDNIIFDEIFLRLFLVWC